MAIGLLHALRNLRNSEAGQKHMEAYRMEDVADALAEELAGVVSDLKKKAFDALKDASPCLLPFLSHPSR